MDRRGSFFSQIQVLLISNDVKHEDLNMVKPKIELGPIRSPFQGIITEVFRLFAKDLLTYRNRSSVIEIRNLCTYIERSKITLSIDFNKQT